MKTIIDPVFKKMSYKYSWFKKEFLSFFDKEFEIKIKAEAYKKGEQIEQITQEQRKAYELYVSFLENHKKAILQELCKYIKESYGSDENLEQILRPTAVLFQRNGSWIVLFELSLDEENGLALLIKDEKIEIKPQDMAL